MTKKWMILGALLVGLFLAGVALLANGTPSISWWVIGGGGGSDTVGSISLDGTIGQWVVGSSTSGTRQLGSGFCGGGGAARASGQYPIFSPVLLRQYRRRNSK